MRLDHVSYAAGPEGLAACAQRMGAQLGAPFVDGGLHPTFGTRNFILPLANGCYLEVVKALDHPAVDTAPFGRAVRDRSEQGGGWLAWAIAVDDIAAVEQRLGRQAAPGHRRRPDGVDLRWRQIGLHDVAAEPQLPFFVQWEVDAAYHPAAGGGAVTLRTLEIAGDEEVVDRYLGDAFTLRTLEIAGDEEVVDRYLGESSRTPLDGIDVEWIDPVDDERGIVAVVFDTAHGEVRLD